MRTPPSQFPGPAAIACGMRIAITGASGLIGGQLLASLHRDGHEVRQLVRRVPRNGSEVQWDPQAGGIDAAALRGVDAVVHLAGAGVGDRRWTSQYKQRILESRTRGTDAIARAVVAAEVPVLISASAIGFYGDTADRAVDETSGPGSGFLADVVVAWEAATQPAVDAGVRVAYARTGLVAAGQGGAFGRMLPLSRMGLGGPLGDGRQYWSPITLRDEVRALRFLLKQPLTGPFNLTAPTPVTNREFTATLGRALHRPTLLPVPRFALSLVVGEFAGEILGSQRVLPTRLLGAGFNFADATLQEITASLL